MRLQRAMISKAEKGNLRSTILDSAAREKALSNLLFEQSEQVRPIDANLMIIGSGPIPQSHLLGGR